MGRKKNSLSKTLATMAAAGIGGYYGGPRGAQIGGAVGPYLPKMAKRAGNWITGGILKKRIVGRGVGAGVSGVRRRTGSAGRLPRYVNIRPQRRSRRISLVPYGPKDKGGRQQVKAIVKSVLECDTNSSSYVYHKVSNIRPTTLKNEKYACLGGAIYSNIATAGWKINDMHRFIAFSPKQLMDAASVLYNGKAKTLGWDSGTDNFANFPKVDFGRCSWKLKATNNILARVRIEVYECVSRKNADVDFLESYYNGIDSERWKSAAPTISNKHPGGTGGAGGQIGMPLHQEFGGVSVLKSNWAFSKVKDVVLESGQHMTLKRSFSGCIEFDKYTDGADTSPALVTYGRNQGICFCVVVTNEITQQVTAVDATNLQGLGHYSIIDTTPPCGIFCEVEESYIVREPEVAAIAQRGEFKEFNDDYYVDPTPSAGLALHQVGGELRTTSYFV